MKTALIFVVFVAISTVAGALILMLHENKKIRFFVDLFTVLAFLFFLVKIVMCIDQNSWLTPQGWMYFCGLVAAFLGAQAVKIEFKGELKIPPSAWKL